MDPNWNKQEQEIIRLLGKLGVGGPEYPAEKLAKRRAAFVASIGIAAAGSAIGTKTVASLIAKLLKATQVEKIVIGVELTAIAGLATYLAITTYAHRNELRNTISSPPTATVLTTHLPSINLMPPTEIPGITVSSTETPVPSMIASSSVTPALTLTFDQGGAGTPASRSTAVQGPADGPNQPTAPPKEKPATALAPKDNPGLHLGQTKQPTKKP